MATISNEIEVQSESRNSRLNEITAIALIAFALLLGLCLASYHPNDSSWNAAGEAGAHNWIGTIGANVSAALFQAIGLAGYLLPFLLLAAAWRRFRSRRINAPVSRMAGLVVLVLSSSALLSLANIRPFFDASVNAGGLAGAIIARVLVAGLNTIGATILLAAIAATGVLLATNFSFAAFYERLTLAVGARFEALQLIPERFRAWRQARRERKQQRVELRRQAKAEASVPGATLSDAAGTQIVGAEHQGPTIGSGTDGNEIAAAFASFTAETTGGQKTMSAAAGAATAPSKRLTLPLRGKSLEASESALVEEMVREAAVKRRTETPATGALPFEGRRVSTTKTAASDYQLPSVDLLNEGPARREQADDELLNMATKLAEKCREFNVTGQIKFICPGPVVTTYEFKPDPGVKYSRVTG
ncbi:MAG TPA: DNA translocase FtsK 4TM domain-containing protein, partial [Pyrinomonadaceae bacterium]|nr:DNA translocase FtsK 4TM domain-containing protein [Pyrinomonadaceae bacterium]